MDKLTFIAEIIQNSTHDELTQSSSFFCTIKFIDIIDSFVFQKGYLAHLLTREGYTQNLQYFRSPVDYNIELGQLV